MSGPVAHRLAGKAWSTEKHTVGSSRIKLRKLVKGDDVATIVHDASTSRLCDTESTNFHVLGSLEHAHVIGHSSNDHSHFSLLALHEAVNLGERERWAVHSAHEKPLQHNLVEFGIHATGEETVQLNKHRRRSCGAPLIAKMKSR